ncbi:MAG: biopolymer transport protein ExbD [Rhodobacteraceae bacterium HLUCCA12]|nr:MAG: biopolymer transport protein ExbD [Rhodobacteraceae bacterium HLUCCA12]
MPEARRLVLPRRRSALSLTSLIDVIFLLLLFFMLSSTFSRQGEVELTAAGGGAGAEAGNPLFLQLGADEVTLNAETVSLDGLAPALAALTEGPEALVLVALRPDVTSQRLIDLLAALRATGYRVQVLS